MTAVTTGSDFGAQENKVCHCFHCFPIYLPWSDGTGCKALRQLFNLFKAVTLFVLRRTAMPTPPMDLAFTVEWIWDPSRLNLWAYLPSPHHPVCSTRQGLAQGSTAPLSTEPDTVTTTLQMPLRTSSPLLHVSSLWAPFDGGNRSGYLIFIRELVISFLPSTEILPRSKSLHSREKWVRTQSRKYLEEKDSWETETPAHLLFYSQLKDSTWHRKVTRKF